MASVHRPKTKPSGGRILHVRPGSEADALGLRAGDVVVAINGYVLRDVIDYQFHAVDEDAEMLVRRNGSLFTVRLTGEGPLGIEFAEPSFDGIRRCTNRCLFCFVDQLPPSLRRSLYVKDDDYRYSVLYGNFVTLSNFNEEDWRRVAEQRISPLHVSVHCTDTALRRHLLGNPNAPDILPQLRRLIDCGIQVRAQVVLCPGFNDGAILEKTVLDLAGLYPGVQTIGIVPVALSSLRKPWMDQLKPVDSRKAEATVADVHRLQRLCRQKLGVGFAYLADEFYLIAGKPIPSARSYDGFPQYENGIGMVRSLKDGWKRFRRRLLNSGAFPPRKITVVCGRLIEPVLADILRELAAMTGWIVELVPVDNKLFGPNVTVSGLLSGNDVLDALTARSLGDCLVLPRSMLDNSGSRFLDDVTPEQLESRLAVPARFAQDIKDLVEVSSRSHIT